MNRKRAVQNGARMKKLQVKGTFILKDKGRFFKVITVRPVGDNRYVFGCRELCSEKSEVLTFRLLGLLGAMEAASLPSKDLYEAYEEKRKAYLDRKYAEYLAETQRKKESTERMIANTAEHQREVLEQVKKKYFEGKIPVKRLAYEIKQRLGISQAPAYDLRIKLLEEISLEKLGKKKQDVRGNGTT